MPRRLVTLALLSATLAGCGQHVGDAGVDAMVRGSASGFGQMVVVAEGPAQGSHTPVPVAWETEVVPYTIQEVRGPRAVAEEDGPYLLDTGDRLRVFVYGQPSLSRIYPVDHDGRISVPLIGHVHARGLTTSKLEGVIKARLGAEYVKDPHVTVDIAQNRPFFILGEVRQAGQYPFVSGMTVQAAVAIAGGYSERADERRVQITRRINGVVEKIDAPSDYVVLPGDTLYIYERWF